MFLTRSLTDSHRSGEIFVSEVLIKLVSFYVNVKKEWTLTLNMDEKVILRVRRKKGKKTGRTKSEGGRTELTSR